MTFINYSMTQMSETNYFVSHICVIMYYIVFVSEFILVLIKSVCLCLYSYSVANEMGKD